MPQPETIFQRLQQVDTFLEALWQDEFPADSSLLLWTLPDELTYWCSSFQEIKDNVTKLSSEKDLYIGIGSAGTDFLDLIDDSKRKKRRCPSSKIKAIPGFFLDIDVEGVGRKKNDLFKNKEEAESFIKSISIEPSITIWSGGGFQLYYLFKEAWTFDSDEERNEASSLSKGFNSYVKNLALSIGRNVDSTFNLDRIFRLPGTFNLKNGKREEVKIVNINSNRYNPSDFEQWKELISVNKTTVKIGAIIINGDAEPPFEKWEYLYGIDDKFRKTWHGKRKDLKDQSASSYDLSLANQLAFYDWTDQEIVNTLIARRRKNNLDLKLRESYYANTVKLSRSNTYKIPEEAKAESKKTSESKPQEKNETFDREAVFSIIQQRSGLNIKRVIQYGEDDPSYSVQLDNNKVIGIGKIDKLKSFDAWLSIAMIHGEKVPHRSKADDWHKFLTALKLVIELDESRDTDKTELFLSLVRSYAAEAIDLTKAKGSEIFDFINRDKCFIMKECLCLRIPGFRQFLKVISKESMHDNDVLSMLRLSGFKSEKIQARDAGRVIGRSYWIIKTDLLYDFITKEEIQ